MHQYFICEDGPMGGVSIVAVAAEEKVALSMFNRRRKKNPEGRVCLYSKQLDSDIDISDVDFPG